VVAVLTYFNAPKELFLPLALLLTASVTITDGVVIDAFSLSFIKQI
jgi:hypothetical protein